MQVLTVKVLTWMWYKMVDYPCLEPRVGGIYIGLKRKETRQTQDNNHLDDPLTFIIIYTNNVGNKTAPCL